MTLVVAAALESSALVVADGIARDLAGGEHPYEKLSVSDDGQDLFGVAGTTDFAEPCLAAVRSLNGLACDEEIERRFRAYARFEELPFLEPSVEQELLHVFRIGGKAALSHHSAMAGAFSRTSMTRPSKAVGVVTVGSGAYVFHTLLFGGTPFPEWEALQRDPPPSEEEVYDFLVNLFGRSEMTEAGIGPVADAYVLRDGEAWKRWE